MRHFSMAMGLAAVLGLSACRPGGGKPGGARSGETPAMPVVAVAAKIQPVSEAVSLVGTLAANEEVEVKAETDGIVQEVAFQEGQEVEKGALLLRLDETKLAADLAEAEARLRLGRASFERAKQLLKDRLISEQEYDQAASTFEVANATVERQRRLLNDARVLAPFKGRTGSRNVSPGQVITRSTAITWLVDLDPVKVEMNVPERFLGQTRVGQTVDFEVTAYPGKRFRGEIYFIAPRLDLGTRTALVKTRIPNPDGLLKSGMVASLEFKLKIREAAILVPEVALVSDGDRYFLFVVGPDQTALLRPVEIGKRLPRWVEITSGVNDGDLVVVEGHQKIGPGVKLALAPPEKSAIYRTLDLREPSATNAAPTVSQ